MKEPFMESSKFTAKFEASSNRFMEGSKNTKFEAGSNRLMEGSKNTKFETHSKTPPSKVPNSRKEQMLDGKFSQFRERPVVFEEIEYESELGSACNSKLKISRKFFFQKNLPKFSSKFGDDLKLL
jgi:hypothetical protein